MKSLKLKWSLSKVDDFPLRSLTKQFDFFIALTFISTLFTYFNFYTSKFIKLFIKQQSEGNCFPLNFWLQHYQNNSSILDTFLLSSFSFQHSTDLKQKQMIFQTIKYSLPWFYPKKFQFKFLKCCTKMIG